MVIHHDDLAAVQVAARLAGSPVVDPPSTHRVLADLRRLLYAVYQAESLRDDLHGIETAAREVLVATGAAHPRTPARVDAHSNATGAWAEANLDWAKLVAAAIELANKALSAGQHATARAILQPCCSLGVPSATALMGRTLIAEADSVVSRAREDWQKAHSRVTVVPVWVGWNERAEVLESAIRAAPTTAVVTMYLNSLTPIELQRLPYRTACDMVTRIGQNLSTEGWAEYSALLAALAKLAAYDEAEPLWNLSGDAWLAANEAYWRRGQPLVDAGEVALTMFKGSTAAFVERLIDR